MPTINHASIAALRTSFQTQFRDTLTALPSQRDRVATTITSSSTSNTYGWLRSLSSMREWIGPRQIDGLEEAGYVVTNKHYEKTFAVNANHIEDDELGQYQLAVADLATAAGQHPETLVFDLLNAGFTEKGWDGVAFFSGSHPRKNASGKSVTFSNTGGGSGTPWFLMDTTRSVRPIILQQRKPITFTTKDRPTDDNVFDRNEYVYGADWRGNVGFGFPQLAYGSKQTLDAAAYKAARAAILTMKGDGDRKLGLRPNLLVVPPSLEGAALEILNAERDASGATNVWRGTAEALVVPWLE